MIRINVDTSQTVAQSYGFGDGHFENIKEGSLREVEILDSADRIRKMIAHYRFNGRDNDFAQKGLERTLSDIGIEEIVPLPFVYDHETADRVLDYLGDDANAKVYQFGFQGYKDALLTKNSRLSIDVPSNGISSDWQIINVSTLEQIYDLRVKRYLPDKYIYVPSPTLPPDESYPVPPDLTGTPPDPVSGITVTGSFDLTETSDRMGILTISYTPPDDGNYANAQIALREAGVGSYIPYTTGYSGGVIRGLKLTQAYDVQVTSISPSGQLGLGIEKLATTIGTPTGAPTTPATPTVDRFGRTWHFRITPNAAAQKIAYYVWEITTSAGSVVQTYDRAGTEVSYGKGGTGSETYKARAKAVNIYDQESSYSNFSSALATEQWQQGHMATNSVGNPQLQADSVDHLKIGALEVETANIDNLAATNAKLGSASVDEFKRIDVYTGTQSATLGNVDANRVIKGNVIITHGLGRKPMVAIRFSAASVDASDRLQRMAVLTSVNTNTFTIHWEVGNHGGLGTINAGSGTFEWWYW